MQNYTQVGRNCQQLWERPREKKLKQYDYDGGPLLPCPVRQKGMKIDLFIKFFGCPWYSHCFGGCRDRVVQPAGQMTYNMN